MRITLEKRFGEKGAWNEGKIVRGDSIILVDGVAWGHVEMKGHGRHGNSFEFHDANGLPIQKLGADGKERLGRHYIETAWGSTKRTRRDGDESTTDERIIAKAEALIAAGRLRSPEDLQAEAAREGQEAVAWLAKRDADRAMMADALRACWSRTDLTNAQREGLALAWSQCLPGSITGEAAP